MFYYYGRKKKYLRHYPLPTMDTIIEPFAGSASYALYGENWRKNVVIVERDAQIAGLWKWLISDATRDDLLSYPDPVLGEQTADLLHILHMASKRWHTYRKATATPFMMDAWRASKRYMADNVHKIKNWTLIEGDYTTAPDVEATWFIDPPYQGEPGTGYRHGSADLNYEDLASWIRNRKGQVIACDHPTATYLPFQVLQTDLKGHAGKVHAEGVYLQNCDQEDLLDFSCL